MGGCRGFCNRFRPCTTGWGFSWEFRFCIGGCWDCEQNLSTGNTWGCFAQGGAFFEQDQTFCTGLGFAEQAGVSHKGLGFLHQELLGFWTEPRVLHRAYWGFCTAGSGFA